MTMQSSHTHPNNTAILVGRLGTFTDTGKGRKSEVTMARRFTSMGGEFYEFVLLLTTPTGEPIALRVSAGATTPGFEFLASSRPGDWIAVEGMVRYVMNIDRRFARSEQEGGRSVRDMELQIGLIRPPRDDEPRPASAAWLEGVITEPPKLLSVPRSRSLLVALTTLEVEIDREVVGRPSYPGLRRVSRDRLEVPLVIPADHEQAGYLFNPGNRVRVDGEVGKLLLPQYGHEINALVDKLRQEWEARKVALAGRSPKEQEDELRRHRKQIDNLTIQPRTLVLVSFVEPLGDAQPISLTQARAARREFSKQRQQRGPQAQPIDMGETDERAHEVLGQD